MMSEVLNEAAGDAEHANNVASLAHCLRVLDGAQCGQVGFRQRDPVRSAAVAEELDCGNQALALLIAQRESVLATHLEQQASVRQQFLESGRRQGEVVHIVKQRLSSHLHREVCEAVLQELH